MTITSATTTFKMFSAEAEGVLKTLNDNLTSWKQWRDTARDVQERALFILAIMAAGIAIYLGIPLIPFTISIAINFLLEATVGLRIVHEGYGYLGASWLSSYVHSPRSLAVVTKVGLAALIIILPTVGIATLTIRYAEPRVEKFRQLAFDMKCCIDKQNTQEIETEEQNIQKVEIDDALDEKKIETDDVLKEKSSKEIEIDNALYERLKPFIPQRLLSPATQST